MNKYDKIVDKYYGYLQHFLEDGGWPCVVLEKNIKKTICKDIPALYFNEEGRLCKEESLEFDDKLVAAFYKISYKQIQEEMWELSQKLHKLADEY